MRHKILERLRLLHEDEDDKDNENEEMDSEIGDEAYSRIKGILDNPIFNHAEIARRLWDPKNEKEEATLRSLFRKKLNREKNADSGYTYSFTKIEAETITDILSDIEQKISRALPRRKKGDDPGKYG
jgi:hypothetical protein